MAQVRKGLIHYVRLAETLLVEAHRMRVWTANGER